MSPLADGVSGAVPTVVGIIANFAHAGFAVEFHFSFSFAGTVGKRAGFGPSFFLEAMKKTILCFFVVFHEKSRGEISRRTPVVSSFPFFPGKEM